MSLHRRMIAVSAASLLLLSGSQNVIADEYEEAVKSAYSAWDAAFNAKDGKAVAAFYTDDAYFLPPSHKVIEGHKGIAEFFSGLFKNGVTGHKLEMIEADGNATSSSAPPSGQPPGRTIRASQRPSAALQPMFLRNNPTASLS